MATLVLFDAVLMFTQSDRDRGEYWSPDQYVWAESSGRRHRPNQDSNTQ